LVLTASLWSYFHLDTVLIYVCESRIPGAEESSQKIMNNYGNFDDCLHTGVHGRLIFKYLLGIAIYNARALLKMHDDEPYIAFFIYPVLHCPTITIYVYNRVYTLSFTMHVFGWE
jgi:hypothetical protein